MDTTGQRDPSFTPPTLNNGVRSMVVLPDGKSLIDGHFTDAGGNPNTDYVARLGVTGAECGHGRSGD